MDGWLIFVFKEVALQEMLLSVTAEGTILSPQWLFPSCLPLFSLSFPGSRGFWGARCGSEWFPHGCRAGLCRAQSLADAEERRWNGGAGAELVCLNILYKYHSPPALPLPPWLSQ